MSTDKTLSEMGGSEDIERAAQERLPAKGFIRRGRRPICTAIQLSWTVAFDRLVAAAVHVDVNLRLVTGRLPFPPEIIEHVRTSKAGCHSFSALLIMTVDKTVAGYPRFAAFVDSYPSFFIYRRFGYIRARLLLYQQDRLTALEKCLEDADVEDSISNANRIKLGSREMDEMEPYTERMRVMKSLKEELKTYGI